MGGSRMNKAERKTHVLSRSEELAKGGECRDWCSIELRLRVEGFPEAMSILDDSILRQELDQFCKACYEPPK